MFRALAASAATALAAVAAFAAVPAPTASGASCAGVTTVVDAGSLGGGVSEGCGSGPNAIDAFRHDFAVTDDPRQPGFVCRIDGAPSNGQCRATDAYWALFVSEGGHPWSYATVGAYALAVSDGDGVAFVWQSSDSLRSPSAAPPAGPAATATPTPQPSAQPSVKPTKQPSAKPSRQPSSTPTLRPAEPTTPSASPTAIVTEPPDTEPTGTVSETPAGSPSEDLTESPSESLPGSAVPPAPGTPTSTDEPAISPSAQQSEQDQGVPTWLVLVLVGLVLLTAIALAIQRRRTSRTP